ncbi:MAG: 50S ribosomal protein L30 [Acidobacteria bacterium]|nr:50S ribosomal protein L30 [Acidobacteriota bacterium]
MDTIKIRQVRSAIGYSRKQREVLRSLGLRRLHQVVERQDLPAVRGMVAKIPHLVEVVEEKA